MRTHGKYEFVILATTAILFATCRAAKAYCNVPPIRLDDEFFTSSVVFTGEITNDHKLGMTSDGFFEARLFTFRVDRVFRGDIHSGDRLVTYTTNTSARFPLGSGDPRSEVGRKFLIFASADEQPELQGKYGVDNCGNSGPLLQSQSRIREIARLRFRHGGLIYGSMMDGDEGVHIAAHGFGGTYTATSGKNGRFSMRVHPGLYVVTASMPGHTFVDTDIAYKSSQNLSVPDGGSAGVSFREKGR